MKILVLIAVLFAACVAQTQNPDPSLPRRLTPTTVRFLCTPGYVKDECLKDVAELRKALAAYPLQLLGEWSFYLVSEQDWIPLARRYGGNMCSVAFTMLKERATVLDRRLISPSVLRTMEMQRCSGTTGPMLLELAITHELGHGICQEKNERKANDYGRELRAGKTPSCVNTPGQSPAVGTQGVVALANDNQK